MPRAVAADGLRARLADDGALLEPVDVEVGR